MSNPKVDFSCPIYLQWLKEIWHVEINEEPRHLWPGQYLISGWYKHEKESYTKAEKEWEKRLDEAYAKKRAVTLQELADGINLNIGGEDYFHWNVETPGWSLHKDGTWNKMLINLNDWRGKERVEYPGVYGSYKEACATLGMGHDLPQKFEGYEKYLNDFVESYDYTK